MPWSIAKGTEPMELSRFHLREGLMHPNAIFKDRHGAELWALECGAEYRAVPVPYNRSF